MAITALARCQECRLLYRIPTDPAGFGDSFYQEEYEQGFTTDLPRPRELRELVEAGFKGSEKDFSEKIEVLRALGIEPGQQLLDYGASWGYGTWQLQQAGYEVFGFEISLPRAQYGREMLDQIILTHLDDIDHEFDVFFTSHVLEHVPNPRLTFELAGKLLRPGGLFVAFTPNGSSEWLRRSPRRYHTSWGMAHPQLICDQFTRKQSAGRPTLLCSSPYQLGALRQWGRQSETILNLDGPELLIAMAYPHKQ